MADWEHLANAPITEALVDIRTVLPPGAGMQQLSDFRDAVSDAYPNCKERRKFHGQLSFDNAQAPVFKGGEGGPDGYLLTSASGTEVVQGRLDGFTFSRLKPYEDWESLLASAKALWARYRDTAKPTRITRVALRYINRLEIPVPIRHLKDWILTVPEVAPELPQTLAGIFMRLHIPFTTPPGFVIITQHVETPPHEKHIPLIFDIDAFLPEEFDPANEQFWGRFEDLHAIKNSVFFNSLTDATLELYR